MYFKMCKGVCQHCQKSFRVGFPSVTPPEESALWLLGLVTSWAVGGVCLSEVYPGLYSGVGGPQGGPEHLCAPCGWSSAEGSNVLPKPFHSCRFGHLWKSFWRDPTTDVAKRCFPALLVFSCFVPGTTILERILLIVINLALLGDG